MSGSGESLRRRVIDGAWLRALLRAGEPDRLGAEAWADVLTHAGLRPLLSLSDADVGDDALARALARVRAAGEKLEAAERGIGRVRGVLPNTRAPEVTLGLAAVGLASQVGPWASPAVGALVFGVLVGISLLGALHVRVQEPTGSEDQARREMAAAVRALVETTWVSRTGDAIFENVPHADDVRTVVSRLDHTVDRARVRADELQRLDAELVAVNQRLGRSDDDPDLVALRARRSALDLEIRRVEAMRTRFGERLLACEGDLERLRLLARRRAVHRRIQQLGTDTDTDDLSRTRAEAEVDIAGFDAEVGALAREVEQVEQTLAARVEVAGLR